MEYDIPYPIYITYIGPYNVPLGVICQGRVVTCFSVWPPSSWGVLRWCAAPRMVGRAALGWGVLCCVALCVVVVCGPPYGGACCVGVWAPSWWGVLG